MRLVWHLPKTLLDLSTNKPVTFIFWNGGNDCGPTQNTIKHEPTVRFHGPSHDPETWFWELFRIMCQWLLR